MKRDHIFIIILFFLFSCYSEGDIYKRFTKINENVNISLRITFYIRTTEVEPEDIYIENLRTFETYKLIKGNEKYFYINNIPAGQYRLGFFIATYKVNKIEFKIFTYSNFIFNLSKPAKYFLGNFFYQYGVNSDKITPIKIEIKDIKNISSDFVNYSFIKSIDNQPIEKSHIYRILGYGKVYSINENNKNIELDIIDIIEKEKFIIDGYFKIIDREVSKNGINDKVIDLILGYYIITNNINLAIKKSLLYYNANKIDESLNTLEEIKDIDPNIPEYYSILGEIEFNKNEYERSKEFLYRAISNKTSITKSYDLYAKILIRENNYKEAKIFSDYSLQKEKDNIEYIKTNLEIHRKLDDKKNIIRLEKRYMDLKNGR